MKKAIVFIIFLFQHVGILCRNFLRKEVNFLKGILERTIRLKIEITNAILFKDNVVVIISPSEAGLKWRPKVTTLKVGGRLSLYNN